MNLRGGPRRPWSGRESGVRGVWSRMELGARQQSLRLRFAPHARRAISSSLVDGGPPLNALARIAHHLRVQVVHLHAHLMPTRACLMGPWPWSHVSIHGCMARGPWGMLDPASGRRQKEAQQDCCRARGLRSDSKGYGYGADSLTQQRSRLGVALCVREICPAPSATRLENA